MKPVITIVGRPNAGKSTLFNRLTRSKDAIVDDFPGVTRDRHYGSGTWNGREFTVIDTGGFLSGPDDMFSGETRIQIEAALSEADCVILLFDGSNGLSPYDREMAGLLRGVKAPVFAAVNKIDGPMHEDLAAEFFQLGFDPIFSISAEHNYGVADLMDHVISSLPPAECEVEEEGVRIAVIGRPNVGKSSLVNRILGEERVIVSDIPGTTRDAIDTRFSIGDRSYVFIDTAGIRKKSRVTERLEKYSVIKALSSLKRCDIALIVMDASEGITEQDIRVAGYAYEQGCGCIFLLNKWDLVEKGDKTFSDMKAELRYKSKYLSFAPILAVSALTGRRVKKVFEAIDEVYDQYCMRVATGPLNRIIERAVLHTEPSLAYGRRIKFYYTTQAGIKPPSFVTFTNYPEKVHFSYQRYLVNRIREETGLNRVPIRLLMRKRGEEEAFRIKTADRSPTPGTGKAKNKKKNRPKTGLKKKRSLGRGRKRR